VDVWQLPAPSQVPAEVTIPLTQLAATQIVPWLAGMQMCWFGSQCPRWQTDPLWQLAQPPPQLLSDSPVQMPPQQTPLWQSEPCWHIWPFAHRGQTGPPQSLSVSCPFLKPSVHDAGVLQRLFSQVPVGGQAVRQSPQWSWLVVRSVSQPSLGSLLQSPKFWLQMKPQTPPEQVAVALAGVGQLPGLTQPTQLPLPSQTPLAQLAPAAVGAQVPEAQVWQPPAVAPAQAPSQQMPLTQWPEVQAESTVQGWPLAAPTQTPLAQV
jgi:hypothetical protein